MSVNVDVNQQPGGGGRMGSYYLNMGTAANQMGERRAQVEGPMGGNACFKRCENSRGPTNVGRTDRQKGGKKCKIKFKVQKTDL
jgi:hypothetical protein